MKTCRFCKEVKPETDFYKNSTNKDKLQSECKKCHQHVYYHAKKTTASLKKNKKGFTHGEYCVMLKENLNFKLSQNTLARQFQHLPSRMSRQEAAIYYGLKIKKYFEVIDDRRQKR